LSGEALLRVEGLEVRYGAIRALRDVRLEVHAAEIVTLLRALSGLVRPVAGRVHFQGADVTGHRPEVLVALGISHVPEGRRIFANLTVRENLQLGAYLRPETEPEGLERVFGLFPRLRERLGQRAGTLSGGEQQMLAIGRALMAEPKLLLLDEPSLGLAPILVQQIFEIIREIHEQGTTVVLVEQNARQALRVASRAYVLETGAIALDGPAQALAQDPRVREAYLGEDAGERAPA
jgi:branched-chain amino acid transport system ATP-binding protein